MKRSEAIGIIADFVYELGVEPDETEQEAELILSALERAGMSPPLDLSSSKIERESGINLRRWESEDEN